MPPPELVAHRGYPLHYPENTLVGLRAAAAAGARRVEIDVQLSAEGTPFLFHDATLERVCGRPGRFAELADAEVALLGAGEVARLGPRFAAEPVPSLARFAAFLDEHPQVFAFVEVKPAAVEHCGAERTLAEVARRLEPLRARCALISFSLELLRAARAGGRFELGLIVRAWEEHAERAARELDLAYVFCDVRKLPATGDLEAGAPLAVYEVVDPELALELGRRGAAYIETFAIGEMLAALRDRAPAHGA